MENASHCHSIDLIPELPNGVWSQMNTNNQSEKADMFFVSLLFHSMINITGLCRKVDPGKVRHFECSGLLTQPCLASSNNRKQTCRRCERCD